jgi:hypothetical protein
MKISNSLPLSLTSVRNKKLKLKVALEDTYVQISFPLVHEFLGEE